MTSCSSSSTEWANLSRELVDELAASDVHAVHDGVFFTAQDAVSLATRFQNLISAAYPPPPGSASSGSPDAKHRQKDTGI